MGKHTSFIFRLPFLLLNYLELNIYEKWLFRKTAAEKTIPKSKSPKSLIFKWYNQIQIIGRYSVNCIFCFDFKA
jgi:hypothetical protein